MALSERFWNKVDKDGPVSPRLGTKCWIWTGAVDAETGYGKVRGDDGKTKRAHVVGFELQGGKRRRGDHVCHHCDVRRCIRGDHLFAGTRSANMKDAFAKGRGVIPRPRGERNPMAKLREADVVSIRAQAANGARQIDLAAQFHVSQAAISKIVRREWWAHVA